MILGNEGVTPNCPGDPGRCADYCWIDCPEVCSVVCGVVCNPYCELLCSQLCVID
ncbi:MAG: hypothetical protein AB1410_00015 [Acidobacteriota bacterium]